MNNNICCADAVDSDAEFFEIETNILDHVVWASAYDNCFARAERSCHDGVLSDSIAAFGEYDFTINAWTLDDLCFVKTRIADGVNFEAEAL